MATTPIVTSQTQVNPQFWLDAAHGAVRHECGWHVAPVITETLVLDGRGGVTLLLPSQRISNIISAKNDGVDVTASIRYSRNAGMVDLPSGWTTELGGIEIELEHGYPVDEVPDVAALIVGLTKRAAQTAGGAVGIGQQGIGPASVRYLTGADGGQLSLPLLQSEKDTLAPYKLVWGP